MPNMNRTGPRGEGPLTGRGLGPCGRGFSGRGFGQGFRSGEFSQNENRGYEPMTKSEQKQLLEEEIKELETEIKRLKQIIQEL